MLLTVFFVLFLVLGEGMGKGRTSPAPGHVVLVRYQSRVKVVYHCFLSFWPSSHWLMSMLLRR